MAREQKRRKTKAKHEQDDPTLEAIRRAEQRDLAEHAIEMAEQAVETDIAAEGPIGFAEEFATELSGEITEKVDSATGYVDAIHNSDAGAIHGGDDDAGGYSDVEATGAGDVDSITSGDVDGLTEIEASIAGGGGVDDMEAAAEEMGARPGEWIFPKLEIPATSRSGSEEAQAFFEFSRRFNTPRGESDEE